MDGEELSDAEIVTMLDDEARSHLGGGGDPNANDKYRGRRFGPRTTAIITFAVIMILLPLVILRGCNSDDDQVAVTPAPSTVPATTVAPRTTVPPTTAAPTTTAAPATTVQATTTIPTTTVPTTTSPASGAVQDAFLAAATYHDESLGQIAPDLEHSGLQVYCAEAASVDGQFITDLAAISFPASAQPAIDALVAALTAKKAIDDQCASSTPADADRLWSQPSTVQAHQAAIDAEVAARAALGLPPAPPA